MVNDQILDFSRDFGLILFVYAIGLQVGPGFFASLRKQGLRLNLLAVLIVLMGVLMTLLIQSWGHIPGLLAVGLYSGGTTNSPSLGAVQQILKDIPRMPEDLQGMPGLGLALSYPFGILGTILAMVMTRLLFRINISKGSGGAGTGKGGRRGSCDDLECRGQEPEPQRKSAPRRPRLGARRRRRFTVMERKRASSGETGQHPPNRPRALRGGPEGEARGVPDPHRNAFGAGPAHDPQRYHHSAGRGDQKGGGRENAEGFRYGQSLRGHADARDARGPGPDGQSLSEAAVRRHGPDGRRKRSDRWKPPRSSEIRRII